MFSGVKRIRLVVFLLPLIFFCLFSGLLLFQKASTLLGVEFSSLISTVTSAKDMTSTKYVRPKNFNFQDRHSHTRSYCSWYQRGSTKKCKLTSERHISLSTCGLRLHLLFIERTEVRRSSELFHHHPFNLQLKIYGTPSLLR